MQIKLSAMLQKEEDEDEIILLERYKILGKCSKKMLDEAIADKAPDMILRQYKTLFQEFERESKRN